MSYIRFYSNYSLDHDSIDKEAVFIDSKTTKHFSIAGADKKNVLKVLSLSWEETTSLELRETALSMLKGGVAYLAEDDLSMSYNDNFLELEDNLLETKMLGWLNSLTRTRNSYSNALGSYSA